MNNQPITVTIPHKLSRQEARRRIDEGFEKLAAQVGVLAQVHRSWSGDLMRFSAKVMGQGISGRLDIGDEAVKMEIDLPPLLAMLAGKIKGRLQQKGQVLLENKKT